MQRLQAFKYELIPDGQQQRDMCRFAGSCRFVFNKALALQQERYQQGEKKLTYVGMARLLTEWRHSAETPWLAESSAAAQQQTLMDLERAYTNFFEKRADFPRFKKKGQREAFRFPSPVCIKLDQANSRICLPKLGWLRYRNSREVLGAVRSVTVSHACGKWYVSILTLREVAQPVHPSGSMVGLDVGVNKFAKLSDGTPYAPLNSTMTNAARLKKAQQSMSRKKKFSNNWKKAKARVQTIQSQTAAARRDHLHKASDEISKNHAVIVVEDLQVKNMSRSAKGTVESPGRNVRQKAGLNRSILDQGWREFRRQLEYKQLWRGGQVIAVPAQYTSQTCPSCEHVAKENRKTQAQFACVACGFREDADLVGAINIRRAGYAQLACEVNGEVSRQQQEPTEKGCFKQLS